MIVTAVDTSRGIGTGSFVDLTAKECIETGWNRGGLRFARFAVNLTDTEFAAVQLRLSTISLAEETLNSRAAQSTASLLAFEALTAPTVLQIVDVVKVLSRTVRALIRLQSRRLDSAED